ARALVAPPRRTGGQAQYVDQLRSQPSSDELATLREWMLDHMEQAVTVDDLAARAHMSRRTLVRQKVNGEVPLVSPGRGGRSRQEDSDGHARRRHDLDSRAVNGT